MSRQWCRKSEIEKWPWKSETMDSPAAGYKSVLATEVLAKVFLLVLINAVFLLSVLHILHSRGTFQRHGSTGDCIDDAPPAISVRQAFLIPNDIKLNENTENQSSSDNMRRFETYGVAVHLFIKMSAYRSGGKTFAIVGLEAKEAMELYEDPPYKCEWIPAVGSANRSPVKGAAFKIYPDVGNVYSRLYAAVVINCTFEEDVGMDKKGGQLVLYASYGEAFPREPERIVALTEAAGTFNGPSEYESASVVYDYIYCGSPLFGNLSPQRIREWLAYHAHFFGTRSHFFLYDAGGIHDDVRRVLDPWIAAGRVTLDNIREQEKYDGYYHNQFMVVNDCFHRARHLSRWLFYFDVDEYLWMPPSSGPLASVLANYEDQTQIIFPQAPSPGVFVYQPTILAMPITQGNHLNTYLILIGPMWIMDTKGLDFSDVTYQSDTNL